MSPRRTSSPRWNLPRKTSKITLAVAAGTVAAAAGVAGVLAASPASAGVGPVSATAVSALAAAAPGPVPVSQPGPAAVPGHPARAGQTHLVVARKQARANAPARHRSAHAQPTQHHPARHHPARHNTCGSSPLHRWICAAESILVKHGVPHSRIDTGAAFIVAVHESGGNPHASNGWDSNAAAGTPSEGIAQIIPPAFATYSLPGHRNIWNPVDNMVAAFRYAISRYGSMSNIPGVVAVRQGGSYVGY